MSLITLQLRVISKSSYHFLTSRKLVRLYPSKQLRTLWVQNPTVSYRSAFAVGGSPPSQETLEKILYPQATPEALLFFYCHHFRERGIKISHVAKFVCPTSQPLKHPAKSAFKRLILMMPLCQHLLLTMSTNPTSVELNDSECEKGQVTQRPPIPYAASKSSLLMMTTRRTIKMKMREGEHRQAILGDGADGEEYVKHLMSFDRLMEKKGYGADL